MKAQSLLTGDYTHSILGQRLLVGSAGEEGSGYNICILRKQTQRRAVARISTLRAWALTP